MRIVSAASALGRIAAVGTRNETPAAQWRTLTILGGGAQRLGELARLSRVTQPGMTRLIGTMVADGLVARTPDPADSRATVISTTEAGAQALEAWKAQLNEALQPYFADLPEEDWAVLTRAAEILSAATVQTEEHDQ